MAHIVEIHTNYFRIYFQKSLNFMKNKCPKNAIKMKYLIQIFPLDKINMFINSPELGPPPPNVGFAPPSLVISTLFCKMFIKKSSIQSTLQNYISMFTTKVMGIDITTVIYPLSSTYRKYKHCNK